MLTPDQMDAVQRIAQAAVQSERETGCPADFTMAQCIFESNYLTRCPGNNCFGIKADAHGSGVQYTITHEFLNGMWEQMQLAFETYVTLADCFSDHARLIQSGVYQDAWLQYLNDKNLDRYIVGVSLHYATDPMYSRNMLNEAHSSTVQSSLQAVRGETLS